MDEQRTHGHTDDGQISNNISSADETFVLSGANKAYQAATRNRPHWKTKRQAMRMNYMMGTATHSTWPRHARHMQMRGAGHPCSILTGFLIFSRYFICKIGDGMTKISSYAFKMRQRLSRHMLLGSILISLLSLAHSGESFNPSNYSAEIILFHFEGI